MRRPPPPPVEVGERILGTHAMLAGFEGAAPVEPVSIGAIRKSSRLGPGRLQRLDDLDERPPRFSREHSATVAVRIFPSARSSS